MPAPKRPRGRPKKITPANPAPKPIPPKAKITDGRGRPKKINTEQWDNMTRMHVLDGVSIESLAQRYDLTVPYVKANIQKRAENLIAESARLAEYKKSLNEKTGADRSIIEQLSERMAMLTQASIEGAQLGMEASAHLMRVARAKTTRVDETSDIEELRPIAALAETANKLGTQGMAVLQTQARKKDEAKTAQTLEDLIMGSWSQK